MRSPAPDAAAVTAAAAGLDRRLDPEQARGLALYLSELAAWNRRMNLVGHADWREVLADLVADSWRLADFLAGLAWPEGEGRPRCVDVGAGAGLPGIPLRLFWTAGEYVLLEPRQKRAAFLNRALSLLRPPRTRAVCGRLEQAGSLFPADLFLSRAFRPWPEVLDLARPRLAPGGRCVILAGEPPPAGDDPRLAGWTLEARVSYSVLSGAADAGPSAERWFWSLTPASMPREESLKMAWVAVASASSARSMSCSRKSSISRRRSSDACSKSKAKSPDFK